MWGLGMDRGGSGQEQIAGTCECGNEPWEFREMRGTSRLVKNRLVSQEGPPGVSK